MQCSELRSREKLNSPIQGEGRNRGPGSLKSLGLVVRPDLLVKMDWGILAADDAGTRVVRRLYWSNQATAMLQDAPTEARLTPDLWGYLRFAPDPPKALSGPDLNLLEAPDSKDTGDPFDDPEADF